MIIDGLLHLLLDFLTGVFVSIPWDIPAMPASITGATSWITDTIGATTSVLRYIYGSALFDALIAVIAAIWGFELIYHIIMWVLRKIPILSIK